MQNIEEMIKSEKITPPGQKNPMRIHSCLEREWTSIKGHNAYIANGKIKKDYEWIHDEGVVAAENILGINTGLEFHQKKLTRVFTRHNIDVNIFDIRYAESAIKEFIKNNKLHFNEDHHVVFGTLFGETKNEYPNFISRDWQKSNLSYSQWGKHPITVENIGTWLREDLSSHYQWWDDSITWRNGSKYVARFGSPTDPTARNRAIGRYLDANAPISRPAGLILFHPDGRLARIDCDSFKWFYEEGLAKKKKPYKRKGLTKEEWDKMTDAQKEAIKILKRADRERISKNS